MRQSTYSFSTFQVTEFTFIHTCGICTKPLVEGEPVIDGTAWKFNGDFWEPKDYDTYHLDCFASRVEDQKAQYGYGHPDRCAHSRCIPHWEDQETMQRLYAEIGETPPEITELFERDPYKLSLDDCFNLKEWMDQHPYYEYANNREPNPTFFTIGQDIILRTIHRECEEPVLAIFHPECYAAHTASQTDQALLE